MFKEISVEEAKNLLSDKKVIFIDVRSKEEWLSNHLERALHLSIHQPDFLEKIQQLDKSKKYIVFCKSGSRSQQAQQVMHTLGFKEVYNVRGSML